MDMPLNYTTGFVGLALLVAVAWLVLRWFKQRRILG